MMLHCLPAFVIDLIEHITSIKGVAAIVIGGSYATGTQHAQSDIDIGLYYEEKTPLDVAALRALAAQVNDTPHPLVTDFGVWGRWVNGGAWLTLQQQRVDLIYRNIDFVRKSIMQAHQGHLEVDYYQQPAFGFFNAIYCGETNVCQIIYDPYGLVAQLKQMVAVYPQQLKKAVFRMFLWDAEFSLLTARKAIDRCDIIVVAGCLTRMAHDLIQVLYAYNETYPLNEKRYQHDISTFSPASRAIAEKLQDSIKGMGNDPHHILATLEAIITDLKVSVRPYYQSPFDLP